MLSLELWSDIVCPWCWIGKHRLERALKNLGIEVQWRFRAYELGPRQQQPKPTVQHLSEKYQVSLEEARQMTERVKALGAELGLVMNTEKQQTAATFDAHRLIQAQQAQGDARLAMERLHKAHFEEGLDLSDKAVLQRLAVEAGMDAAEVQRVLGTDAYTKEVDQDEMSAARFEIRGVPFTVLNGRLAVGGAQPVEAFEKAIQQALR